MTIPTLISRLLRSIERISYTTNRSKSNLGHYKYQIHQQQLLSWIWLRTANLLQNTDGLPRLTLVPNFKGTTGHRKEMPQIAYQKPSILELVFLQAFCLPNHPATLIHLLSTTKVQRRQNDIMNTNCQYVPHTWKTRPLSSIMNVQFCKEYPAYECSIL